MSAHPTVQHKTVSVKKKFSIAENKFLILFLYLLASLICYPYVQEDTLSYHIFRVASGAGTLLAVYAVKVRRMVLVCALLLAVPAVLQKSLLFRADAGLVPLVGTILSFVFDVFIVVLMFRRIFGEQQVRSETLFGAICIYLLIAYSFAGIYDMMYVLQPLSFYFDPIRNQQIIPTRFDFIYYSFATMTSMGAAGITPVSRQARSFTVMETTLGVLYLAVLIARLMSTYRTSPSVLKD